MQYEIRIVLVVTVLAAYLDRVDTAHYGSSETSRIQAREVSR